MIGARSEQHSFGLRHPRKMKWVIASAVFCLVSVVSGQNLVPNGSFEEYTQCPDFYNETQRAAGWSAYRNSPDYFNACEPTGHWSVPHNVVGYQQAATGQAYCGMLTWAPPSVNQREHIGAELLWPLVPGVPVSISFRMVAAAHGFIDEMGYAASGFGVLFTMEPYYITDQSSLPNHAALFVDSTVTDTVNWLFVSGTYVPDSAYRYVVVGGMFDDPLIHVDTINSEVPGGSAYVYVDDICVSMNGNECLIDNDLHEPEQTRSFRAIPNPCSGELFIDGIDCDTDKSLWVQITDLSGKVLTQHRSLFGAHRRMNLEGLPPGALIIRIGNDDGFLREALVIHVEP